MYEFPYGVPVVVMPACGHPAEQHSFFPPFGFPRHRTAHDRAREPEKDPMPFSGVRVDTPSLSAEEVAKQALGTLVMTFRLERHELNKLSELERNVLGDMLQCRGPEGICSAFLRGLRQEVGGRAAEAMGKGLHALDRPRRMRIALGNRTLKDVFAKRIAVSLRAAGIKTPIEAVALDYDALVKLPGIGDAAASEILRCGK